MTVQQPIQIFQEALALPPSDAPPPPALIAGWQSGRAFDLPPRLFIATVLLYLAYLGVMAASFMNPELVIPMVIFAGFVIAGFGTPALWARIAEAPGRKQSWGQFKHDGIDCLTGHLTAGSATVQVLLMPVVILFWGVAIAIIAATMR